MAESPDPRRTPVPVAAALVAVLVLVLLGGGVLIGLSSRPASDLRPVPPNAVVPPANPTLIRTSGTPTSAAVTAGPASPTAGPTVAPTRALAQTSNLADRQAQVTAVAATLAAIGGPSPTPEPTQPPVVARRIGGTVQVFLPGTPTPTLTWWQQEADVPDALRQEVLSAYLHFWDVRAQASYTLDTSQLASVMSGQVLQAHLDDIAQLQASSRAVRVDVEHHLRVLWANDAQAAIDDTYVNRSVQVSVAPAEPADPEQPAPTPTPEPTVEPATDRMGFLMQREGGTWKVVDWVRIVR